MCSCVGPLVRVLLGATAAHPFLAHGLPSPYACTLTARPAKKRARVLREGQLSLIVYGFDEKLVWARRVGGFIRSMRAVLGDRSLHAR